MSGEHFKEFVGKIDTNGDGFISPEEFENGIKAEQHRLGIYLNDEQIQQAISSMEVIEWLVNAGHVQESVGLRRFISSVLV